MAFGWAVACAAAYPAQQGTASYYADKFAGRATASGEIYRHESLTAAHRTLPFGSCVKVTRLSDGRTVLVRVNDRGPFKKNRVIDLSRAAAARLGLLRAGLARVEVERMPARHCTEHLPEGGAGEGRTRRTLPPRAAAPSEHPGETAVRPEP